QTTASTIAQTPMKRSMNTFTVVVVSSIRPLSAAGSPFALKSACRIAPLEIAAPSVFTANPIHAAATIAWSPSQVRAASGNRINWTRENPTTNDDTITGTPGGARMAAPVVIAADTPQMEMPDASGAAHSRLKPKNRRATKYTSAQ